MKFKTAVVRSVVILAILILSVIIGYIYSWIGYHLDLRSHPLEYSELVEKYSEAYGVPEYILYGVMLTQSEFASNYVSPDGRIGLMQLSPTTFEDLLKITKENLETGILYDPETNIKYGAYWLSYLYTEYGRWNTVLSIYVTDDEDIVNIWLGSPDCIDENGNLIKIPDELTADAVAAIEKEIEMYHELYYTE